MTGQPSLFHEDIWQALRDCVSAMGGTKDVGYRMRPELGPEKAGRWLLDCLNPERNDKLSIEQFLFLLLEARRAGCDIAMHYLARHTGYEAPKALCPQVERDALLLSVQGMASQLQAALARIQALETEPVRASKL